MRLGPPWVTGEPGPLVTSGSAQGVYCQLPCDLPSGFLGLCSHQGVQFLGRNGSLYGVPAGHVGCSQTIFSVRFRWIFTTVPRGRVFVSPFQTAKHGDQRCSPWAGEDSCRHTRSKCRESVGVKTAGPRGEQGGCSESHSSSRARAGSHPGDPAQGGTQFTQVPTVPAAAALDPTCAISLHAPSLPQGSAHLQDSSLSCPWQSLHRGSPLVCLSSATVQYTGHGPSAEPPSGPLLGCLGGSLAQSVVGSLVQNQITMLKKRPGGAGLRADTQQPVQVAAFF